MKVELNGNHKHMVAGIALLAIQTYIFLRTINLNLDLLNYAEFSAFWSLTMGVILGFTFPLEGFGLALKNRNLRNDEKSSLEILTFQKVLISLVSVLILSSFAFISYAFEGNWLYLILLLILSVSFPLIFISRARLLREGKFINFSLLINLEGLFRLIIVGVLIQLNFESGLAASLSVTLSSVFTALIGKHFTQIKIIKFFLNLRWNGTKINNLVVASLSTYLILNIGPFAIQLFDSKSGLSGLELNAVTLARSPLFLGPVIQSLLIQRVQIQLQSNDVESSRKYLNSSIAICGLLFSAAVLIFSQFGKSFVEILFGPNSTSILTNFGILASSTAFCLLTVMVQSYFIACDELKFIQRAWVIALIILVLVLMFPLENIVLRSELASLLAFLSAFIYLYLSFWAIKLQHSRK